MTVPMHDAVCMMLADVSYHWCQWRSKKLDPSGRWVVITGCDTGFGRLLAERLHSEGYRVLAGCLTAAGVKELNQVFGSKGKCVCVRAHVDTAGWSGCCFLLCRQRRHDL